LKWQEMEADIEAVAHIGVSKAGGRPMKMCLRPSSPCRKGSQALAEHKWFSMQTELDGTLRRASSGLGAARVIPVL